MLPMLVFIQNLFTDAKDRLAHEAKGATAVEYGLIIGLMAVALIAAFVILGPALQATFTDVSNEMDVTP
ncbi:hypothetical protein GCM10011374_39870 [Kocuria dechangensis]|uniref:Flp family type IVb pilin n=1 Tax=Kocuria dechangensis TaxID=1176249 RepID=A0A917H8U5_9MICC|nr:Flp family type IVb pilin [Kocuria dechangensis]GGG71223.1 hypothetical protein GCM10011374_39870 [Kocuria dechangensis]